MARPEGAWRLPLQKDEFGDGVPKPGISRHDTTSTTSSGVPLPSGHWTVPIAGNCPRCHHHHRSIKVHIKNVDDSNGLLDVHCEKCNKLWIGPGGRNSTRVSFASIETIDPPPLEPEARTTLVHMIRNATRVATLSPTLPGISEIGIGLSRDTFSRESSGVENQKPVSRFQDPMQSTTQEPLSMRETESYPRASSSHSVSRIDATKNNIGPRRLMTSLIRKLGPNRLGRIPLLTKWFSEAQITIDDSATTPPRASVVMNNPSPAPPRDSQGLSRAGAAYAPLVKETGAVNLHASLSHDRDTRGCGSTIDQDSINKMNQHERIALLRSQITTFSAQYNSRPVSSTKSGSSDHQEQALGALATIAAIHNSLLTGVGDAFGQCNYNMHYSRDPNAAINAQSLHISDTRTSEASTVVNGQSFASENLLREAIHRAYQFSSTAHAFPGESGWEQSRRDMGHIRDSFELATAHNQSAAPESSGTSNPQSGKSLAHVSSSINGEDQASAAQLPDDHQSGTGTIQSHNGSDVALDPLHSQR